MVRKSQGLFAVAAVVAVLTGPVAAKDDALLKRGTELMNGVVAALINSNISSDLADGTLRLVTELRDVDDVTLTTDPAARLVLFVGLDGDMPIDPTDDFSHMESFYFRHSSVDPVTCELK